MKTLYFDCFSGAGGDMLAAALIDAGVPLDVLGARLEGMGLSGFRVRAEKLRKQGFAATKFDVETDPAREQPHRRLHDIHTILENAPLSARVCDRSKAVFERLARAEAEAHGISAQEVHFHEVGAVDAIVDVVTVLLAIDELAPDRILCSALPVGSGTVSCAHGVMPIPAPATALLLRGVPLAESEEQVELLTPTAAAILTTLAERFGPIPAMTIDRIGVGAGTRDNKFAPNLVRVFVGKTAPAGETDTVAVLEANIDDASGECVGHCLGRLLEEGALDAYCVPIQMKKHRPGVVLTVICETYRLQKLESVIFAETSTFGVRRHFVSRSRLERHHETVETPFGRIRIKVGRRAGRTLTATAEYEDCAAAASRHQVALRVVMDAAVRVWQGEQRLTIDDH